MEGKKFSIKSIINQSIGNFNGNCKKMFASSLLQYVLFFMVYLLTRSYLISFVVWATFLPSQLKFLSKVQNEQKLEPVLKLGKSYLTAFLTAMLFVFVSGAGFVCLIFPAVMFFANYALVFSVMAENDNGIFANFKEAQRRVVGYRGKIAFISLIFLLILVLLVGLSILLAFVIQLIPSLSFDFIKLGLFIGVSLFVIFIAPVELLVTNNIYGEIEQDKLYNGNQKVVKETVEEENQEEPEEKIAKIDEKDVKINTKEDDDGDIPPTDYIF